ncbi:hypothetical protein [Polynucleobacter sp.]|uniref:hypothetical protein n=1 Tax=Polynucleobacter sp. TaxID=2029855 RepID=UPI003F696458
MGKICDRNYAGNSMYTMKMIDGVGCCPNCNKPAICHNASVESRALFWALSGDTGNSSRTIAGHMTGNLVESDMMPPGDRDDRSRCIRLLELIPEWLPRLDEMKKYDAPDTKPEGVVINNSGIGAYDNSWSKQIPLIAKEGNFYA